MKRPKSVLNASQLTIFGVLVSGAIAIVGANQFVVSRELPPESPTRESSNAKARRPAENVLAQVAPETFETENRVWPSGVRWQKRYVALGAEKFPVFSLELDPRSPQVELRPIWSNPAQMAGTQPLKTIGQQWRTFATINGGFFNRKNRLPLGAIRREDRWYSGPILNRGAIAWDSLGNVQIGRLSLNEAIVTPTGERIFLKHLNSGYVQAGVARYTPEWGPTYQPLTNNELLISVQNDQVIRQDNGGIVESESENINPARPFPIPANGYLLVIRARSNRAEQFPIGSTLTLTSGTIPASFAQFPHTLGAGPLLLQNGQVVLDAEAENFSAAFNRQAASRSFIGQTRQGTLILGVVHNRPEGKGPTLPELAQLTQRLGLVNALNLDGGSSSSLFLEGEIVDRDPRTAARVHNGLGIYTP